MTRPLAAVVLAAGVSKRMRSSTSKSLHPVGGRPMLAHVLAACESLEPEILAVVTPGEDHPVSEFARSSVSTVHIAVQERADGTAGAFLAAQGVLDGFPGDILVVFGDTPLLRAESLQAMQAHRSKTCASAVILAFEAADPTGYGRVLLSADGTVERIVEQRDATPEQVRVHLCAAGPIVADAEALLQAAREVGTDNAAGERYLTDIPAILNRRGQACRVWTGTEHETLGVNSRMELSEAEQAFQARARLRAMQGGATLEDPGSVRFSFDTELEPDVTVGSFVSFGPGVRVRRGASVLPFCSLEGCEIGPGARIGPHARIRPGTVIGPRARVGNYVEVKAAQVGDGAKINHLAYVGDATVGPGANIGAGAITCNFDGVRKYRTEIGAGAFIGSNCCLVAPVRIGDRAYVGSGSVITRDVEADALAIERGQQVERPGLASRLLRSRKPGA